MYEKGSSVKVTLDIGQEGIRELEFVGRVVIDGADFMAVQFDTIIIPKVEITSAEPIPEGQDLEQVIGTDKGIEGNVDRPKPPTVGRVRFLPLEVQEKKPAQPQPPPGRKPPTTPQPRKK
jgi:hypothetical protein